MRIEWIDDHSANIVFDAPTTALRALESFTIPSEKDALSNLQIRAAKGLSTHLGSHLEVRTALFTDQKRPRAYEASRFYMMHPEHDPREQRRRDRSHQHSNGDCHGRKYGEEEQRRRRHRDHQEGFAPSMYDDNGSSSRHNSMVSSLDEPSDGGRRGRPRRNGDSYRPARDERVRTSRDRSASPESRRRRRRAPPPPYRNRDPNPFPLENKGKELFPSRSTEYDDINVKGKDLFSNKMLAANLKKDLFPHKVNTINHRRSDAFDAADETADLFAHGLSVPFTDGPGDGKRLDVRVTRASVPSYGRLNASDPDPDPDPDSDPTDDGGLNIRGLSKQQDQGLSIRGGAAVDAAGKAKELFPGRVAGNAGKELFVEKLQGRGGKRNRAEDMFY